MIYDYLVEIVCIMICVSRRYNLDEIILVENLSSSYLPKNYILSADDVALGVNLIKDLTFDGAGFGLGFGGFGGCHWWFVVKSIVADQLIILPHNRQTSHHLWYQGDGSVPVPAPVSVPF